MKDNYGFNPQKTSSKPLTTSPLTLPSFKGQELYIPLLKKKDNKLTNFETFLKSKLETSTSTHSANLSPKRDKKSSLNKLWLLTDSPSSLLNNTSVKESIFALATARKPTVPEAKSPDNDDYNLITPRAMQFFQVKKPFGAGAKTPVCLTEAYAKEKVAGTTSSSFRKKSQKDEIGREKAKQEARSRFERKNKGMLKNRYKRDINFNLKLTRSSETLVEKHVRQEPSLDRTSLEGKSSSRCQSTIREGISFSDYEQSKIQTALPLNTTKSVEPNQRILKDNEDKSNNQTPIINQKTTSIRLFKNMHRRNTRETNNEESIIYESLLTKLKNYDKKLGTTPSVNSTQRSIEEIQVKTLNSFAERSSLSPPRILKNSGKTLTNISPTSLRNESRINSSIENKYAYLPDWLITRNDFKKVNSKIFERRKLITQSLTERTEEELEVVARWLQNTKIFKNLPFQLLESIASKLTHRLYDKNEALCLQGESGDCLYIIHDGMVRCIVDGKDVALFKKYDAPGQNALESSAPRTASLVAAIPTSVLRLEREAYCTMMEVYIRKKKDEYLAVINEVKILKDLSEKKKQVIASCLQAKHFSAGEIIYSEGEAPECFYILKSGQLQIQANIHLKRENFWPIDANSRGKSIVTRNMKFKQNININEYFGEMELVTKLCLHNSQVLWMNKKDFFELFDIDDFAKFKNVCERHLFEDADLMRKKMEEKEAEKKRITNVTVTALKHHISSLDIPQPKSQVIIESNINKFKNELKQYIRQNTVGKPLKKVAIISAKSKDYLSPSPSPNK